MLFRSRISLFFAILLLLLIPVPALAGGWAVITLDELPSRAMAGEPLTVGFTVRQHGRTLMTGLYPKVSASLGDEHLVFSAEAEGGPGHYAATLTLPTAGDWQWGIEAFTMYQPMPALSVVAPEGTASLPAKTPVASFQLASSLIPLSLVVLALGLVAAVIGFRRRSRPILLSTALCLLTGFALLAAGTGLISSVDVKAQSEFSSSSSLSQVEMGRQLFLAKGCITCHSNSKATGSSQYTTIEMGAPDLSKFSASPEVLRLRLQDPTQVKSDTMMPNLELSKPEIEALIAFINSK
jgi:hypothetical protein